MKLTERLRRWLVPEIPKIQYMCIRCDKVKDDVPGPWSHCTECRAVIAEIALEHPDVYREYAERMRAARMRRPYPDKDSA